MVIPALVYVSGINASIWFMATVVASVVFPARLVPPREAVCMEAMARMPKARMHRAIMTSTRVNPFSLL